MKQQVMKLGHELKAGNMIYLNEAQTSKLINHQLAYEAIENAFCAASSDKAQLFPVVNAAGPQDNSMFSMKSASTPALVGWKTGSYWPENQAAGIPCHGTTIFLLSPETGALSAIVEANQVNAYRTAAADAVAVNHLANEDASVLTVFGTGHQAEYEVSAICEVRNISQVFVVGRTKEKQKQFIDKLSLRGIEAQASEPQPAVKQADIIVTATTACEPLFNAEWVKQGTHISAMGADKQGKQELPIELYTTAQLFCDFASQSAVIGEFQHANGACITELGHVIQNVTKGRASKEAITIFDSSGIAIQDLFIADKLISIAK